MLKASDIDHWQSDVIFLVVPVVHRWPMFVCITYYFFSFFQKYLELKVLVKQNMVWNFDIQILRKKLVFY